MASTSHAEAVVRAHAKINLCLEVIGRRADGYHEVATVLQTIDLADRLRMVRADHVRLQCHGMEVESDNLILRAASMLKARLGVRWGCEITCWKRIPIAAGLGGGSADAAATLVGLNRLWDLSLTRAELMELASEIGSDVPFAVHGGAALARGTGTALDPLPDAGLHWLVLVPLEAGSPRKSAEMYRALGVADFTSGAAAQRLADSLARGTLQYGDVGSAFTRPALQRWPEVGRAMSALQSTNPLGVSVSGAGPSVFALYQSRRDADRACATARAAGIHASVHRFALQDDSWVGSDVSSGNGAAAR
ncbi:MAG TPA: 4-(cytidine 5'-diphospho)-2-C-methyl-D-erythritol kinase [Chloroflexota bacterium]|nr:4-(cytidine 5'-diphospho)-2-C-methyl-D-erythritol kinase [Chloroflexota bacterium]